MAHRQVHKRVPQLGGSKVPSNIQPPAATGNPAGPIVSASGASSISVTGLTTITTAVPIITLENGQLSTATSFSTLTLSPSSQASSGGTSSSKLTSSTPAKTSAAAASHSHTSKSSTNLGTLIPAIVVPVVAVLLISFGLFWFFMRRRHHRELKNTDFVMAGKGEKLNSRTNSSRSTGGNQAEKSTFAVTTSEVKPFSNPAKLSVDDIGVARPLTPKDGSVSQGRSPNQSGRPSREQARYQNFSGPRPSTSRGAGSSRMPEQGRSRSNSSPAKRGPPPSAYHYNRERDPYGLLPPGASDRGPPPPRPHRGPSPNSGPRMGPPPLSSARSPPIGSGPIAGIAGGFMTSLPSNPRPAPPPPVAAADRREPSPTMNHSSRAPPPHKIDMPGAYNGASPISQYSPIIKETPNLGAIASFGAPPENSSKPATRENNNPPPLQTKNLTQLKVSKENSRSASPISPSFLSDENMAIARLANSSRLGFNTSASPSAEKALNPFSSAAPISKPSNQYQAAANSPATQSSVSPKLPPPATRSQLIPLDMVQPTSSSSKPQGYFGNSKPASPSTSSFATGTRKSKHGHQNRPHDDHDDDNDSVVSDLDHYEDIDAKSDVSSLNEIERFEFESRNGSSSALGHGSNRGSGSIRGNTHGLNFRF